MQSVSAVAYWPAQQPQQKAEGAIVTETLTDLCKRLEHFETPIWAADAILQKEILTQIVVDPCAGAGVLTMAAKREGYQILSCDIHNYGFDVYLNDWLGYDDHVACMVKGNTVFMNPPFSKAVQFVEKAFELGARKIVCFQRFAWWESKARRDFWQKHPPNRVYICQDRADCWRHDVPVNGKGRRFDSQTGKEMAGTTTAHAWFVWERGQPAGTLLGHISKAENT